MNPLLRQIAPLFFALLFSSPLSAQSAPFFLSPKLHVLAGDSAYAVGDATGRPITPFQFRYVNGLWPERFVASTDGEFFGGWDAAGRPLLPQQYDRIDALPGGNWAAWRFGQCALLGPDGLPRTPFVFQKVLALPDGRILASNKQQGNVFRLYDPVQQRLLPERFQAWPENDAFWQIISADGASAVLTWAGRLIPIPCGKAAARQPGDPAGWIRLVLDYGDNTKYYGWYDLQTGKCVAPGDFITLFWQSDRLIAVDDEKTRVYDRAGSLLQTLPFQVLPVAGARLWVFRTIDGDGLCDTAFQILRPAAYAMHIWSTDLAGFNWHLEEPDSGGILDAAGREVALEFASSRITLLKNAPFLIFEQEGRYGALDLQWKTLLRPEYDMLESLGGGYLLARKNDRFGLLDSIGNVLLPFDCEKIRFCGNGAFLIKRGGKFGLSDARGRELLPLEFEELEPRYDYDREAAFIGQRNGRWGVYNPRGQALTPTDYENLVLWNDFYFVKRAGKFGVLNSFFREIVPPVYDTIFPAYDGLLLHGKKAEAYTNWRWSDNRLIPTKLTDFDRFSHGLVVASEDNTRWGLYTDGLRQVLPPVYDKIMPLAQPGVIAVAQREGRCWAIRPDGTAGDAFACDHFQKNTGVFLHFLRGDAHWLRNLTNGSEMPVDDGEVEWFPDDDFLVIESNESIRCYDGALHTKFPGELKTFSHPLEDADWAIGMKNDRYGVFSLDGREILPFEYDEIMFDDSEDSILNLSKNGKIGFYNLAKRRLFPAEYDLLRPAYDESGYWLAGSEDALALFSPVYERLTDFDLEDAQLLLPGIFLAKKAGRLGLLDARGKNVLPFDFDQIEVSEDTSYLLLVRDELSGAADLSGRLLIEPEFADFGPAGKRAFIGTTDDNQSTIFDRTGKTIEARGNEQIYLLTDSSFSVQRGAKYNLLLLDGRWVGAEWFDELSCDSYTCAARLGDKWELFDLGGRELMPLDYDLIAGRHDTAPGLYLVGKNGLYGYADARGRMRIPLEYDYADPFVDGLAAVRRNGKWGYLDTTGHWAIPPRFDYAASFLPYNHQAVVLAEGRYSFIDSTGKVSGPLSWARTAGHGWFDDERWLGSRSPGLPDSVLVDWHGRSILVTPGARIVEEKDGLVLFSHTFDDHGIYPPFGVMNYAGQVIAEPVYETVWFEYLGRMGVLPAKRYGKLGFIDPNGQAKLPFVYDEIRFDHLDIRDLLPARKGKKWGFIDLSGNEVIPFKYDKVWNVATLDQPGVWIGGVHKHGKSWIIDRQGRKIRKG